MFHENRLDVIRQIKELIYTRLKPFKRNIHEEILIDCMDSTGISNKMNNYHQMIL